jgi:uncharacterized protein with von Willebrand factor type A (vWA) domain
MHWRCVGERTNDELFESAPGGISRCYPRTSDAAPSDLTQRLPAALSNKLLLYSLHGNEEKGKGPVVVCLDGSSSMMGDKEIWAKALALTFFEIARRQRRLFHSICFSSVDTPLHELDLNPRERYRVEMDKVIDLAEYFPGGGTDFETALDAALACLRQSRFNRGDIIFITN